MSSARRGSVIAATLVVIGSPLPGALRAQEVEIRGPASPVPIDRWLVSSPFPAPGSGDGPLTGPGEEGVLPDRGIEQAGASWMLVRRDGLATLRLDSLMPDREPPVLAYAHSYVRLPEDRNMILSWKGLGPAEISVWINGRRIRDADGSSGEADSDHSLPVRLGAGWNTLLFRVAESGSGEAPFGLSAGLATERGGATVRIQASRPPGDVRTGPEPWVIAAPGLTRTGRLAWSGKELLGQLSLEVTGWSRSPIDEVAVRLRAEGVDARGSARWLTPGTPVPVGFWIPQDRLERLQREGGEVEVELEWEDEKTDQRLPGPTVAPATERVDAPVGIALSNWEVRTAPGGSRPDRLTPSGPLPDAAGWTMSGKWEVPDALGGRDLFLDASASPGDFRIGDRAFASTDRAPLCTQCRKGDRIEILARSSDGWTALPRVFAEPAGGDAPR